MSTTAASKSAKSNRPLPALVKTDAGSMIVPIATKTGSTGRRLMTKWEFRRHFGLSRSETETKFAEYFAANSAEFSAQTADKITRGQLHVHAVTASKGGAITLKAKTALPKPEEIKETVKQAKPVLSAEDHMKALGITPEMLALLKDLQAKKTAPTQADAVSAACAEVNAAVAAVAGK